MPRTIAQQERSLDDPAVCELLEIRDFLDGVMVRTDGCYVAGFRVGGALTYFADDEGRNAAKTMLESLLRAVPEAHASVRKIVRFGFPLFHPAHADRTEDACRFSPGSWQLSVFQ